MTIKVIVIDKEIEIDEFTLEAIDRTLYKWELGGITDPIGQLISWLWNQIHDAFNWLWGQIYGFLRTVRDTIVREIDNVGSLIHSVVSEIESIPSEIANTISALLSRLESSLGGLKYVISSIEAKIIALPSAILNAISSLKSFISNVVSAVESIAIKIEQLAGLISPVKLIPKIISFVEQIPIKFESAILTIKEELSAFSGIFKTIITSVSQIGYLIRGAITRIYTYIEELSTRIVGAVDNVISTFTGKIGEIISSVEIGFDKLKRVVAEIGVTLAGFVNPLVEIKNWLVATFKNLWADLVNKVSYIADIVSALKKLAGEIGGAIESAIKNSIKNIEVSISDAEKSVSEIIDKLESTISNAINNVANFFNNVSKAIVGTIKALFGGVVKSAFSPFGSAFKSVSSEKGAQIILGEVSKVINTMAYNVAESEAFVNLIAMSGDAFGDIELSLEPLGVGGKARLKIGDVLRSFPKAIFKISKEILSDVVLALTFWIVEPMRYYVYKDVRNYIPVELPSVHETIEIVRRSMPTQAFNNFLNKLRDVLALRGYADWVIESMSSESEKYAVKIRDRFGKERTFPLSLMYELPTISELCRMMMRDEFASFDDFVRVINARGVTKDVAKMFYLLHYRYPSLRDLYEFACRCASGFAWVTEKPVVIEDLGYPNAKAPVELNVKNVTPETVKNALNEFVANYLKYYAKWLDYSPFSWLPGWTADNLIILDLMAEIPQRIDARWMYKWGIIDDKELMRIVVARGIHPDWIERVTVAECMNALSEERTFARTGVIELAKRGFATLDFAKNTLSHLTDVEILGNKYAVRFLDGEVALLLKRVEFDRAYYLMNEALKVSLDAFAENVIAKDSVVKYVSKFANNMSIDANYLNEIVNTYSLKHEIETIRRMRYWVRAIIWRATYLAENGVDPKELVEKYAEETKMTEEEKALMLELVKLFTEVQRKRYEIDAIINRMRRGLISKDQAISELKKLGVDESLAEAIVEAKAYIYTLHPSTFVSMMDYIPIPRKLFESKMRAIGMPEDEIKLYYAYAYARTIRSEFMKEVTAILDEFERGLISENEARRLLKQLATLDGKVKRLLGVDWVILDDDEINFLIEAYKIKRKIRESRRRR